MLYFASTDCPISNRYIPEIERLERSFSSLGVKFWWVYPNPEDDAQSIAKHRKDFSITGSLYPEQAHEAVDFSHVTVTPEAAIFLVDGNTLREVYHGRIDDRYISLGQERPQAQHHDLELAITAALAGKPVPQPEGPAVGCSIVFLPR